MSTTVSEPTCVVDTRPAVQELTPEQQLLEYILDVWPFIRRKKQLQQQKAALQGKIEHLNKILNNKHLTLDISSYQTIAADLRTLERDLQINDLTLRLLQLIINLKVDRIKEIVTHDVNVECFGFVVNPFHPDVILQEPDLSMPAP